MTTTTHLKPAQVKALRALARLGAVTATNNPHRGAIRPHVLATLVELGFAVETTAGTFTATPAGTAATPTD